MPIEQLHPTSVDCLCLHNSYRPQMLTAYAYETVMDHKCYCLLTARAFETATDIH